jgi:hypothetical protein
MEKRVFGIILTVLGIIGLIMAAMNFMNGGSNTHNVKEIFTYSILGVVFFFSGITLIRSTRDKAA